MSLDTHLSTLNNALTLTESLMNFVGYLPESKGKDRLTEGRQTFGKCLTGVSLIIAISTFAVTIFKKDNAGEYANYTKKALFYAAQGALNIVRGSLEQKGFGSLTLAYDLCNQKFLPYTNVNPSFDLQSRAFAWIKTQLSQIDLSTIIPTIVKKVNG